MKNVKKIDMNKKLYEQIKALYQQTNWMKKNKRNYFIIESLKKNAPAMEYGSTKRT